MTYPIQVADVSISVTRKRIRHLHLRVHPPDGRVTISSPIRVSRNAIEEFATSRLDWIRRQQERLRRESPEPLARFVSGEIHYVWGCPQQLTVVERDGVQGIVVGDHSLTMYIRPGSVTARRAAVMQAWHKAMLREELPALIRNWEERLGVRLNGFFLRRMKTRWGTCNYRTRHIRLNTELATRDRGLLDYVVAQEMVHLIVPNHGPRFVALMNAHYPTWRAARSELNRSAERAPAGPGGAHESG